MSDDTEVEVEVEADTPPIEGAVATPSEVHNLIDYFIRTTGRVPGLADVILMQEAVASVALSHGDVGTYTFDDEEPGGVSVTTGPGGAYTAAGPDAGGSPTPADVGSDEKKYTAADMHRAWWEGHRAGMDTHSPYQ